MLSANASGKEICAVKHGDPKARKGCFLTYKYTKTYAFDKRAVEKAVCYSFFNWTVQKPYFRQNIVLEKHFEEPNWFDRR